MITLIQKFNSLISHTIFFFIELDKKKSTNNESNFSMKNFKRLEISHNLIAKINDPFSRREKLTNKILVNKLRIINTTFMQRNGFEFHHINFPRKQTGSLMYTQGSKLKRSQF